MATTKLEAINVMLQAIGEAPVADIEDTGNADVVSALDVLSEIRVSVLTRGWYENTIEESTLSLTVDNKIPTPSNVLRLVPIDNSSDVKATIRGDFLFDVENNTNIFDAALKVKLIQDLPWEDLPEHLQHFIKVRAARTLVQRDLGDGVETRFTAQDEARAEAEARKIDTRQKKLNTKRGSVYNINIGRRRPR